MNQRRSASRPHALLLLAALAAVLQWAVPHGWMVGAGGVLVPCPSVSPDLAAIRRVDAPPTAEAQASHSEHAAYLAQLHHDHPAMAAMCGAASTGGHKHHHAAADPAPQNDHSKHADQSDDGSALCDFAALGTPVLLPGAPELPPAPPPPAVLLAAALLEIIPGRGLAAPPPPSTGPPPIPA